MEKLEKLIKMVYIHFIILTRSIGRQPLETAMNMLEEIVQRVEKLSHGQQEEMLTILKDWQQDKKREFRRLKTQSQVDVAGERKLIQTNMRDVSASGIFINSSGKFDMDEKVKIVFSIPGYEKPFKLNGIIVRVEQRGMAIQFEEITPYFKAILDEAICKADPNAPGCNVK